MTSSFASLAGIARHAVDAVHGEAATLKPQDRAKGPHGAKSASAARPVATITVAFFHDVDRAARNRAQPQIGQTGDRLMNRSPEIFGSTAYDGDIAVGDHLLRDGDGQLFEIVWNDADGTGGRILGFAAIKG